MLQIKHKYIGRKKEEGTELTRDMLLCEEEMAQADGLVLCIGISGPAIVWDDLLWAGPFGTDRYKLERVHGCLKGQKAKAPWARECVLKMAAH